MRAVLLSVALAALIVAGCDRGEDEAAGATEEAAAETPATEAALSNNVTLEQLRAVRAPAIQEAIRWIDEDCQNARFDEGGIQSADLNGDGLPDYLVSMQNLVCGGPPQGGWCGSGGCAYDLFVSRSPTDYVHESYQSMDVAFVRHDDGVALNVPSENGDYLLAWNGSEMAEVQTDQSRARAAQEAAVRQVVDSIYQPYVTGRGSVPDNVETQAFQQAIRDGSDPDVGLGYDFYCGCQDYENFRYEITDVTIDSGGAFATVRLRNFGGDPYEVRLQMQEQGGRWRVDDVWDANGSLRVSLEHQG